MPQPRSTSAANRARLEAESYRLRVAPPGHRVREIKPYGRLVRYTVKGLFGQQDQSFDFATDGPTILTGANGSGKTTILKTINAISDGAWLELTRLPFEMVTLKFEKGPHLKVAKTEDGLYVTRGSQKWQFKVFEDPEVRAFEEQARQMAAYAEASRAHGWQRDPALRRRAVRAQREMSERQVRQAPVWIQELGLAFPVRFITDQRLVIHSEDLPRGPGREVQEEVRQAVSEYGTRLGRRMEMWLNGYARASQQEDRRFPEEIIEAMSAERDVDEAELQELIDRVANRRAALQQVGLEAADDAGAQAFAAASLGRQDVRIVIKMISEATLRKFETLEDQRRCLQLLVDFLDAHFVGKKAATQPGTGLTFTLAGGQSLVPAQLSSGEQQMLVLAYQVLFETEPGTLLLIDEPELSLHVGWQNSFIDDIVEMGRANHVQFLLATHSPTLIGGREELRRSLSLRASE